MDKKKLPTLGPLVWIPEENICCPAPLVTGLEQRSC